MSSKPKADWGPKATGSFMIVSMVIFLAFDEWQSGKINYQYSSDDATNHEMSNIFVCSLIKAYHYVIFSCDTDNLKDHDICDLLGDESMWYGDVYRFRRVDANPEYNGLYEIFFLSFIIGGTVCSFGLICIVFCIYGERYKNVWKLCTVICILDAIMLSVGIFYGILMTKDDQSCKRNLYNYLENEIGAEIWNDGYEWKQISHFISPTWYGIIVCAVIALITKLWMIMSDYCEGKRHGFYEKINYTPELKYDVLRFSARNEYGSAQELNLIM